VLPDVNCQLRGFDDDVDVFSQMISPVHVFLLKNDSPGGKTLETSEVVEYDFCPMWSRVLIFTHLFMILKIFE
jgi:hypothetical protein